MSYLVKFIESRISMMAEAPVRRDGEMRGQGLTDTDLQMGQLLSKCRKLWS